MIKICSLIKRHCLPWEEHPPRGYVMSKFIPLPKSPPLLFLQTSNFHRVLPDLSSDIVVPIVSAFLCLIALIGHKMSTYSVFWTEHVIDHIFSTLLRTDC